MLAVCRSSGPTTARTATCSGSTEPTSNGSVGTTCATWVGARRTSTSRSVFAESACAAVIRGRTARSSTSGTGRKSPRNDPTGTSFARRSEAIESRQSKVSDAWRRLSRERMRGRRDAPAVEQPDEPPARTCRRRTGGPIVSADPTRAETRRQSRRLSRSGVRSRRGREARRAGDRGEQRPTRGDRASRNRAPSAPTAGAVAHRRGAVRHEHRLSQPEPPSVARRGSGRRVLRAEVRDRNLVLGDEPATGRRTERGAIPRRALGHEPLCAGRDRTRGRDPGARPAHSDGPPDGAVPDPGGARAPGGIHVPLRLRLLE